MKNIIVLLICSLFFIVACNNEAQIDSQLEDVEIRSLKSSDLLNLIDLKNIQEFDHDAVIQVVHGGVIGVKDETKNAVKTGFNSTKVYASSAGANNNRTFVLKDYSMRFGYSSHIESLEIKQPLDKDIWGQEIGLSFDRNGNFNINNYNKLEMNGLDNLVFGNSGFRVSKNEGISLSWEGDINSKGIVAIIEYKESGYKTRRDAYVLEDTGTHHFSKNMFDFIPSGNKFKLVLLRPSYKLITLSDSFKVLYACYSQTDIDLELVE